MHDMEVLKAGREKWCRLPLVYQLGALPSNTVPFAPGLMLTRSRTEPHASTTPTAVAPVAGFRRSLVVQMPHLCLAFCLGIRRSKRFEHGDISRHIFIQVSQNLVIDMKLAFKLVLLLNIQPVK